MCLLSGDCIHFWRETLGCDSKRRMTRLNDGHQRDLAQGAPCGCNQRTSGRWPLKSESTERPVVQVPEEARAG